MKGAGTNQTRVLGIPKLEDANDAGGKNSERCTLILTEGDSAKALAVAGLGVVGRDRDGQKNHSGFIRRMCIEPDKTT